MRGLALVAAVSLATGPACSDDAGVHLDFLTGFPARGDTMVTTADGRVHVLVYSDDGTYLESGEPGGSWSLEPVPIVRPLTAFRQTTLIASGGSFHAVWVEDDSPQEPQELFYTARTPDGTWSEPVDLTADLPAEMRLTRAASIAASSTDELALVWSSQPDLAFLVARIADGRLVGPPEIVTVAEEGTCNVLGRSAFDSLDRLVVGVHCIRWDGYPPPLVGVFVARDVGERWEVERLPGVDGQPRIAFGPDDTVHSSAFTEWRCPDDVCSAVHVTYAGGRFGDWRETWTGGTAPYVWPVVMAVDQEGGVYIAYRGESKDGDGSSCENDEVGCLVTSADGSSFTEPRELPGLAARGLRSVGGLAMTARGDSVVLVDHITDGEDSEVVVSTLSR